MTGLYKRWEDEARRLSTNLTEVCAKLGINRSNIQRWKDKDPKSVETMLAIENHFRSLENLPPLNDITELIS